MSDQQLNSQTLQDAVAIGKKLADVKCFNVLPSSKRQLVVIPDGHKLETLDEHVPKTPDRKRLSVDMKSVESFISYVNEHGSESTRIFASVDGPPYMFHAAIDFHEAGTGGLASWNTHNCFLTMTLTDEWKLWIENNGKSINQIEFAEFINQNRMDIIEPDGATIAEIALTLEATNGGRCKTKIDLHDGTTHLEFQEDVTAKAGRDGKIKIPRMITLSLSPFVGIPPETLEAEFRFRTREGVVSFSYILQRPKRLIKKVVDNAVTIIGDKCKLPVFHGNYENKYDH